MACSNINIRAEMGGTAGGTFSYIGYDANSPTGLFVDDPGVVLADIAENLLDDDGWVFRASNNALPVGFYRFKYTTELTVEPFCTKEAFQTFEIVNPRCPGGN